MSSLLLFLRHLRQKIDEQGLDSKFLKFTFFNVLDTSEKSPGAILLAEASLPSSETASLLSDHFVAFYKIYKIIVNNFRAFGH
jgi:hypothetical protein